MRAMTVRKNERANKQVASFGQRYNHALPHEFYSRWTLGGHVKKKITGGMSEAPRERRRALGIVTSDLDRKFVKYYARINARLASGVTLA